MPENSVIIFNESSQTCIIADIPVNKNKYNHSGESLYGV